MSSSIGPQLLIMLPFGQQIAVPLQLAGIGNVITPFIAPPASGPITAAGSAVIFASALCVTRIWPALGRRFADGNPPGIGSMPAQPPHPPPPQPNANKIAVTTTNQRSEEHTSELQSRLHLVCRLLLEKKK